MTVRPTVYVVVPVLNEAPNVPRLMESFHLLRNGLQLDYGLHVLMVDDGSTDGTAEIATGLADGLTFELLTHPVSRGPGAAFGSAFERLAGRLADSDWLLTMEGDNTSRLELVRQMLTRTQEGFDVVLASPYLYGGGLSSTSAYRVFLSTVANIFVREALGLRGIVTMSSFFRLYRGYVLRQLQASYGPRVLERRGFESMIELLLKLVYMNCSISEVAMPLDLSRRIGRSKMKITRTIFGYIALWKHKPRWRRRVEPFGAAEDVAAVGAAGRPTQTDR